jgi:hypothetical protein
MLNSMPPFIRQNTNLRPIMRDPGQANRVFALDELNQTFSQVSRMSSDRKYLEFLGEKFNEVRERKK